MTCYDYRTMIFYLIVTLLIAINTHSSVCKRMFVIAEDDRSNSLNLKNGYAASNCSSDEDEAKAFLKELNAKMSEMLNKNSMTSWNFETNLTEANANISNEMQSKVS